MNYRERIQLAASKAMIELRQYDAAAIERESAISWAGRALAAASMQQFIQAEDYFHEAIEHAALSGDDELLVTIRALRMS